MIRKTPITATLTLLLILASVAGAEPFETQGRIESVTVYRGQALVTRTIELPAQAGELEVIVEDLPAAVIGSSLAASADGVDGVRIRSVRFRSEAIGEAANEEVAELDRAIAAMAHEIFAHEQQLGLVVQQGAYLDKLEQFAAPTANMEMTRGVLDVETLTKLTEMIFARRTQLTDRLVELKRRGPELRKELELLQRKRGELAGDSQQTIRQAVLFVAKDEAAPAVVHLTYLVGQASWSPSYNVRLINDGQTAVVEYLAEVQQVSGEDWSDVALTLSTATPNLNARNPLLTPLWMNLGAATGQNKVPVPNKEYAKAQKLLLGGQKLAGTMYLEQGKVVEAEAELGWALNRLAANSQRLELEADPGAIASSREQLRAAQEGMAVSYKLEGPMNLASRSDRQLVQIARLELDTRTHYEATPLLTNYIHRLAEVTNTSKLPLLNGPYSAYIDQEYVGRGQLPVVAQGQKVTLGFGIDTQLRCTRELVEKSDEIAWGQRVQTFHYRLRLENYKDEPVEVRLYDRIPASKSDDIKVTLGKVSTPLSTDEVYLRDDKPQGLLRWDVPVAASAAGASANDITYRFEMKFAKDAHVGRQVEEAMGAMEADFHQRFARW